MDKVKHHKMVIKTVAPSGNEIVGGERTYVNTPLSMLYPDVPVVFIDWGAEGYQPDEDLVKRPIETQGELFTGCWTWGSGVKRNESTGIPVGMVKELTHLYRKVRDAPRWNRAYLAQGIYGAGYGDIRVKVVKRGDTRGGHMIHDGFGIIRKSLADKLYNGHSKIRLGKSWDSWQFAQRIPWTPAVEAEITGKLKDLAVKISSPDTFAFHGSSFIEALQTWVELDEEMSKHPRVARSLTRSCQGILRSWASSFPTDSVVRVAVPARCFTHKKESVVYVYPNDSPMCNFIVPACEDEEEMKRVEELEVIQYTLTNEEVSAKGLLGVADDNCFEEGVDAYISDQDVKMGPRRANRPNALLELKDAALVFIQYYAKGSARGVEMEIWMKAGRDTDGDLEFSNDAEDLPECAAEIAKFPPLSIPKLVKDNLPIREGERKLPKMLVRGMTNLVGLATNLMGHSFMVADREEMAGVMGFRSVMEMDRTLGQYVKIGTDHFKTYILYEILENGEKEEIDDIDFLEGRLAGIQSKVRAFYGGVSPWTLWKRDALAFKHYVPEALTYEEASEWMKEKQVLAKMLSKQVLPFADGTVGQIARIMLPTIRAALTVHEQIFAYTLSYFAGWAEVVPPEIFKLAKGLQKWWVAQSKNVNWTDGDDVHRIHHLWETRVLDACEKYDISRWVMANAIWRAAHLVESEMATGAAAFNCLGDEMRRIVLEKPGFKQQFDPLRKLKTTGLLYNVENAPDVFTGVGTIIPWKIGKVARTALVGVPGLKLKKRPENDPYPEGVVAMISKFSEQPQPGTYQIHWERDGHYKVWYLWLLGTDIEQHDQP